MGVAEDALSPAELGEFYRACYPRLVGLMTVATGRREDAEEIVQEAFMRLVPRWERISGYDSPEAWVRLVALRLLSNRRRHALRAARLPAPPDADVGPVDGGSETDLSRYVARLPVAQRQVVLLHYVYDMRVEDVARALGVRAGTVKSRLARARAALAEALEDHEEVGRDARSRN